MKAETVGQKVAKRFRKQYYKPKAGWDQMLGWEIQPDAIYRILLELQTKDAVHCLIGNSWTRRLR